MQKYVRVITPISSPTFRRVSDFDAFQRADLRVDHSLVPGGPPSIESRYEEALSISPTMEAIAQAEADGVQAIVIDCMGDPAVEPAREIVDIPVIGPGRLAVQLASLLGNRFGIISVLDRLSPLFFDIVERSGQSDRYVGSSSVNVPVLDLDNISPGILHASLTECAKELIGRGADVIIFGCTGMLGCAEAVHDNLKQAGLNVPVIDPVPVAIHIAADLIDMGLSHSKACYPAPKSATNCSVQGGSDPCV